MTWYTFDKQPPEGQTFLIKQSNNAVYFGRVVDGKIKTCFVFQNIAYVTESEIANTGKPLADWLKAQQPQGQNEVELLWSSFGWETESNK